MTPKRPNPNCKFCKGTGWSGGGFGFAERNTLGSTGPSRQCGCVKIERDAGPAALESDESLPAQSLVAQLESLQKLHQTGALTDWEFARAKARLLR